MNPSDTGPLRPEWFSVQHCQIGLLWQLLPGLGGRENLLRVQVGGDMGDSLDFRACVRQSKTFYDGKGAKDILVRGTKVFSLSLSLILSCSPVRPTLFSRAISGFFLGDFGM